MKKLTALLLAALLLVSMCLSFTACGKASDWKTIQEKGYFYCGITYYEPMNYIDENGDLVGFDTEFAQAVAEVLGVEAKFSLIQWGSKYLELNNGSIDCIWNGFTFGDESDGTPRSNYVDFTYSYLNNSQCVVTTKNSGLNAAADFVGKKGTAEASSAGEAIAKKLAGTTDGYTPVTAQTNALMEVLAGTSDFAVIDILMANAMVGKGDYAELEINNAYTPEPEVYAIGCRKGSDFTAKINEAIKTLSENGKLAEIAAKYGVSNSLIENIGA